MEHLRKNSGRIESIQLLRFFAALCISISHIAFVSNNGWELTFGIELFFVVTGFLTMLTTENTKNYSVVKFLLKKIIRIIPLYWLLTIAAMAATVFIPNILSDNPDIIDFVKSMFLIPYGKIAQSTGEIVVRPIVGPAHTLMYDFYFYIIFAIAMKISKKYRGIIVSGFLLLTCISLHGKTDNLILEFYTKQRMLTFVFGIALYYVFRLFREKHSELSHGQNTALKISCGILSLLSAAVLVFESKYISGVPYLIILCVPSFLLVLCFIIATWQKKFPCFAVYLGNISYSYFLIHYFVIMIVAKLCGGFDTLSVKTAVFAVGALIVSALCAVVSYEIVEQRFCSWLRKMLIK